MDIGSKQKAAQSKACYQKQAFEHTPSRAFCRIHLFLAMSLSTTAPAPRTEGSMSKTA